MPYEPKIHELIYKQFVFTDFTDSDWRALALAAIDQAGYDVRTQSQVEQLLPTDETMP